MSAPSRFLLAALALTVSAGCSSDPWPQETVAAVARAVSDDVPEAAAALGVPGQDAGVGRVEVYVDLSMSVRPYLADGGAGEFHALLEGFDGALGADVEFFGFGFESDTVQAVTPTDVGSVLRSSSYGRRNNDYGDLFARFGPDTTGAEGPLRFVLTDGVESDPQSGRRFGRVVGEVDRWIRSGGAFAVFVYRGRYRGSYFAEAPSCVGRTVALSCDDRPFYGFVFADREEQVDRLRAALRNSNAAPEPSTVVRVTEGGAALRPLGEVEGDRRPVRLLRDVSETVVAGFEPIVVGKVDGRAEDDAGFFPLTFELSVDLEAPPWSTLDVGEREAFLRSLRPRVRAWAVGSDRDSLVVTEVEAEVRDATVAPDSGRVVVTVPVRRPLTDGTAAERARRFAWLVELVPYETGAALVPDELSAPSDCEAGACSRTLNLLPLLGAILRDDYVPARSLVLTEWR